jgi:chromosomal replication initiation ATPase DnaA
MAPKVTPSELRKQEILRLAQRAEMKPMAKYTRTIKDYEEAKKMLTNVGDLIETNRTKGLNFLRAMDASISTESSSVEIAETILNVLSKLRFINIQYKNGDIDRVNLTEEMSKFPKLFYILETPLKKYRQELDMSALSLEESVNVIIQYIDRIQGDYEEDRIHSFSLHINPDVPMPRLPAMFEDPKFNCLLSYIKSCTTTKRIHNSIDKLNTKYFDVGISENEIPEVVKAAEGSIEIYTLSKKLWKSFEYPVSDRIYRIICHNNHAYSYKSVCDKVEYVDNFIDIITNTKDIIYIYGINIFSTPIDDNGRATQEKDYKGIYLSKVTHVKTPTTMYKNKDIFYDDADFESNRENADLIHVHSKASRKFKEVTKYLRKQYPSQETLDAVINSQIEPCVYCPVEVTDNIYAIDQTSSYPAYIYNKYYELYGLADIPNIHTQLTESDLSLIKFPGFSKVINVTNNFPFHAYYMQDNIYYPNNFLQYVLENNFATFEISAIAYNLTKLQLDFNFIFDKENKLINNTMIGMCVAKGESNFGVVIQDYSESLAVKLLHGNDAFVVTPNTIKITQKCKKTMNSLAHVRSYILGYQIISMIETVRQVDVSKIVKIKCDSIQSTDPNILKLAKENPLPGEFKQEVVKNFYPSGITRAIAPKTPIIKDTSTVNAPSTLMLLASSNRVLITGAAGTGKTYLLSKKINLSNAAYIFPTNVLSKDVEKGMTINKFLGIGIDDERLSTDNYIFKSNAQKYSAIVIDEATMLHGNHMQFIHDNYKGMIYLVGDYENYVSKQLPPVNAEPISVDLLKQFVNIHLTKNYRQNGDPEFFMCVTNLRNGIESDYKFDEEIYDGVSPIIVTHNNDANRINDMYKDNDKLVVTLKQGSRSKTICRGEFKVINKQDLQPFHELAFAVTVHKVQGKTLDKCYISKNCRFFEVNHKYVAYTRVRSGKDMKILKE